MSINQKNHLLATPCLWIVVSVLIIDHLDGWMDGTKRSQYRSILSFGTIDLVAIWLWTLFIFISFFLSYPKLWAHVPIAHSSILTTLHLITPIRLYVFLYHLSCGNTQFTLTIFWLSFTLIRKWTSLSLLNISRQVFGPPFAVNYQIIWIFSFHFIRLFPLLV